MLAEMLPSVEQIPQFGALVFGVPLAELIAMGEEALFGARLLLVPSPAADGCVDLQLLDPIQERDRL